MRSGQPLKRRRTLPAFALMSAALFVNGCAAIHDGFQSTARMVSSPVADSDRTQAKPIRLDVKTVRQQDRTEERAVEAAAIPSPNAIPSPKEIFDFHPAGSRADEWRQPFDIDVDEGPLAADVHRTAKELKAFNAMQKSGAGVPLRKPCGETDVAVGRPGCATGVKNAASKAARDPLALR